MRLSCVFVLIATIFLATSEALADSDQIDQRFLRAHPPASADSEERGFDDIPRKFLTALGEKLGIDVRKASTDIKYFNRLSEETRKEYNEGLSKLLSETKKKKAPRITYE
ncbi:hypothetical protein PI124_g17759 [Phytophthora idaei]|nr:hypothetical protein PI125_g16368 [Phytophthora idaei]KAG3135763.1 hypothetical protein PI126_g18104 [Phytophthora idaei]KAG3237249.1 hypothetical protein PI124_g17759 [Phytophthora idaei]